MKSKEEYLKHKILEQGWIQSATIPDASIHVCCREGCDDYSNIYVSYLTKEKEIFFRLTKELPTKEQLKTLIVFNEVTDKDIEEIYAFITSIDKHAEYSTVFDSIGDLFKSMEYEKLPKEKYIEMLQDNTLKDWIDL